MQATNYHLTFVGGGNMASALILGLIKQGFPVSQLTVVDHNPDKCKKFQDLAITTYLDINELNFKINVQHIVVLAVKPQAFQDTCPSLANKLPESICLISIAAGINLELLQHFFPKQSLICRAMPNTPALVNQGLTGIYFNHHFNQTSIDAISSIFAAVGKVVVVNHEQDINLIISGAGSAPAYFFLFMEAMQDHLVDQGIPEETARLLVSQACLGAATMAQTNQQSLSKLRAQVTSKGGTTYEAISSFEQSNLRDLVDQAMNACERRAAELEKNLLAKNS